MCNIELKLEHIQKSYTRPVLTDVNLSVFNESYIAILGKSGSGKSTLLNILGLVESFDSGEYCFNGVKIRQAKDYAKLRLENVGFIFQAYNLIPTLSCAENILLPTLYSSKKQRDFDELVELLDIKPLLEQKVTTLSGGEKQRVAIARSLILDPGIILADEPTGNLDPYNKEIVFDLLQKENKRGCAVVLITHDWDLGNKAKTTFVLEGGRLIEKK